MLYFYRNRFCSTTPWAISTVKLTETEATIPFFPPQDWQRMIVAFEGNIVTTRTFAPGDVSVLNNTITITAHAYSNGQAVRFRNIPGTLPGGITKNTQYFIVEKTDNTFKVSLSVGGAAVDITSQGSGTHTLIVSLYYGQPLPGFDANPNDPVVYVDGAFALSAEAIISTMGYPWWNAAPGMLTANGFVVYNRPYRPVFDDFEIFTPTSLYLYKRRHSQGEWAISRIALTTNAKTRGVFDPDIWERVTVELTDGTGDANAVVQVNWQFYYLVDQYLQNRRRGWLLFPPQFLMPNEIAVVRPELLITPEPMSAYAEFWPTALTGSMAAGAAMLGPSDVTAEPMAAGASTAGPIL